MEVKKINKYKNKLIVFLKFKFNLKLNNRKENKIMYGSKYSCINGRSNNAKK